MYLQDGWGEPPPENATIWRYVSLPILLHVLQTKMVFFSSANKLVDKDPWEGHWGEHEFQNVIATFKNMLDLDWAEITRELLKKSTFVSCWHQSPHESAAMWTIYAREGLALKSTVGALKAAFEVEKRHVGLVTVRYTDQLPDTPPLTQAVFRKRPSFQHEHEIRAVIFDPAAQKEDGIYAKADLEKLLQGIYVSPLAPPWLRGVLREVLETELERDALRTSVELSSLYDPL